MQSFKQFLVEREEGDVILELRFTSTIRDVLLETKEKYPERFLRFKADLKEQFSKFHKLYLDSLIASFEFIVEDTNQFTNCLSALKHHLKEIQVFGMIMPLSSLYNFYELPTKKWDTGERSCLLSCSEHFSSMVGVHKCFNTINFWIDHTEKVKEGGLGFLLIPDCRSIVGMNTMTLQNDQPWIKILNEHLSGERDILECKADLIEQGQGAFAKI